VLLLVRAHRPELVEELPTRGLGMQPIRASLPSNSDKGMTLEASFACNGFLPVSGLQ